MLNVVACDDDINDLNKVVNILSDIFQRYEVNYDLKTFLSPPRWGTSLFGQRSALCATPSGHQYSSLSAR